MKITPVDATMRIPQTGAPRSVGVHVSAIIRCIATEAKILKNQEAEELSLLDFREIVDEVAILRIMLGLGWEMVYLPTLLDVTDHPGEKCVEGVYMTPDGESLVIITERNEAFVMVHEVKATYKGINTVGDLTTPTSWMWMAQCKAYCKALKTTRARLHVLFICGDYSYPIRPVLKIYDIEFTQQEVDDNWSLLIDYRDTFLEEEMNAVSANQPASVISARRVTEAT